MTKRISYLARGGAIVVALLVVVPAAGRLQADRATDAQADGIERVLRAVGPGWAASVSAYRLLPYFDCLLYQRGGNPYALELCFDWDGRVIEAIDRRGRSPKFWSLRYEPKASKTRVDLRTLIETFRLIDGDGAPTWTRQSIPIGYIDLGPLQPFMYTRYSGPH
jgi:hypothetical protein